LVTDSTACTATSTYSIIDRTNLLLIPDLSTVQICAPGDAVITVNNPQEGTYKLFNALQGGTSLAESDKGIFITNVNESTSFFVSYQNGTCETDRTAVDVEISTEQFKPSNTFTPNGDGINDFWSLPEIENYPKVQVQIFNRFGAQIFSSAGYNTPFDGRFNGKDLPVGPYYFMIELMAGCKTISGCITIIK